MMSASTEECVDKMRRDNNDIFAPVRQKLLDEDQNKFLKVPKDLDTNFEKHGGWTGAVSGATAGAALGAHVMIATMGTGLVATCSSRRDWWYHRILRRCKSRLKSREEVIGAGSTSCRPQGTILWKQRT